jgi:hypothetical protein
MQTISPICTLISNAMPPVEPTLTEWPYGKLPPKDVRG